MALLIVAVAFALDLFSASVTVSFVKKSVMQDNGDIATSIEAVYPWWHQVVNLLKNFLYGLSAAVLITVFVANKLEDAQRREKEKELNKLREQININVFDSVFKTILPEEIFKIIKQEIIENKVIRKDAKWILDFSEYAGVITCTQTTRYALHNLSQATVADPIKLFLDPLGGEKYEIISAQCMNSDGDVLVSYNPLNPNDSDNVKVKSDGKNITVEYTVSIPPESYIEYKTVFERKYKGNVTDAQATKVPVIGADIIVNFPVGYEFDISPLMSSEPKLIDESQTRKIYRVDGGILPKQGFIFGLTKK